jgi:hypothetical protein
MFAPAEHDHEQEPNTHFAAQLSRKQIQDVAVFVFSTAGR